MPDSELNFKPVEVTEEQKWRLAGTVHYARILGANERDKIWVSDCGKILKELRDELKAQAKAGTLTPSMYLVSVSLERLIEVGEHSINSGRARFQNISPMIGGSEVAGYGRHALDAFTPNDPISVLRSVINGEIATPELPKD